MKRLTWALAVVFLVKPRDATEFSSRRSHRRPAPIMPAHYIRLPTAAHMFIHTCEVCGIANAPFGYNVSLRRGQLGNWYCAEHKPPLTASTRD